MREITLEDCHKLKTHHFDKYCETAELHEFPILAMVGMMFEKTLEKWDRTGIPSQKEARAMFRTVLKVTGGDASKYAEPEVKS